MTQAQRSIATGGRGSGRTTAAMLAAPKDTYYVVNHPPAVPYHKRLAHDLGRDDLRIVTWEYLRDLLNGGLRGTRTPVELDHWIHEDRPPFYGETIALIRHRAALIEGRR